MADLGLLAGVANALNSGLESYRTERAYNDSKRKQGLLEATEKIAAKKAGFDADTSGNISYTPEGQQALDTKMLAGKQEQELYQPESGVSQRANAYAKNTLGYIDPSLSKAIPEGATGAEAEKFTNTGIIPKVASGIYGMRGREAVAAQMAVGNKIKGAQLERGLDDQAARAGDVFDKDTNLKTLTAQVQKFEQGKHTLLSGVVTPQVFNEINMDIANGLSGGRSAAVSTQEKTEFNSLELDWKKLKQRLTNKPEDIGSPEVKEYIASVLDRLSSAYKKNMSARAQQLSVGREYKNNPAAQRAIQEKAKSYGDPGLLRDAPAGGKVKVSNGQETLMIPSADLEHAVKDGYKQVQ